MTSPALLLQQKMSTMKLDPHEMGYVVAMQFFTENRKCLLNLKQVPPVRNSALLKQKSLKPDLQIGKDLHVVNYEVWSFIQENFGGGPEIRVSILPDGTPELYPPKFIVKFGKVSHEIIASKSMSMATFHTKIVAAFSLPPGTNGVITKQGDTTPIELTGLIADHFSTNARLFFTTNTTDMFSTPSIAPSIQLSQNDNQERKKGKKSNQTEKIQFTNLPKGLKPLEGASYINSVLQCFLSLADFPQLIPRILPETKKSIFIQAFYNFLTSNDSNIIRSAISTRIPIYAGKEPQDLYEFILHLLNFMHEECPKGGLFESLFYGNLNSYTCCKKCKPVFVKEIFNSLSIPIIPSTRTLYIPYDLEQPILSIPEISQKEISNVINDNNIRLEIPLHINSDEGLAFLSLQTRKSKQIGQSILIKVPLGESNNLQNLVWNRIKPMWIKSHHSEIQPQISLISPPNHFTLKNEETRLCNENIILQMDDKYFENSEGFRGLRSSFVEKSLTVEDLVSAYFNPSTLDEDNLWQCGKCGQPIQAQKYYVIQSMPKYLLIQLKRTTFTLERRMEKDQTPIDLSMNLSFDVKGQEKRYRLVAVTNHIGNLQQAHYSSVACRGDHWYSFKDQKVEEVPPPIEKTTSSYILFYSEV